VQTVQRSLSVFLTITFIFILQCAGGFPLSHPAVSFSKAEQGINSINPDTLENEIRYLASDQMEGRKTTYPGQKKAASYLASYFRHLGLTPIDPDSNYLQEIPMYRNYLDEVQPALAIQDEDTLHLHYRSQFSILPSGISRAENLSAPVVFAGYGIQSDKYGIKDYDSLDVEDKWVLVIDGEPQSSDSMSIFDGVEPTTWSSINIKRWTARRRGAVGLIVIGNQLEESLGDSLNSFTAAAKVISTQLKDPAISLRNVQKENKMPTVYVSDSVANQLLASTGWSVLSYQKSIDKDLRSLTTELPLEFTLRINVRRELASAENIVGVLRGSDPEFSNEYVALTAHYDHLGMTNDTTIYNGADDNATGTSIVLSSARAFTLNQARPKRSILFMLVAGEEEGLLGSTYFVNNPLVDLSKITANVNIDMVGRNAPDSIFVIGSNMLSKDLDALTADAVQQIPEFYLDYRFDSKNDPHRYYYRSDHYNFAKHNIPVVFFFAGVHPDYHQPTDTPDKINYRKVTKVGKLAYLTSWAVANYSKELKLNGVLTHQR